MDKNNNLSLILLAIIVFIIGFLGGSLWTENNILKKGNTPKVADTVEEANPLENVPLLNDEDHVRGNRDAKVVMIEYSDYECPYCNKFHPTMLEVMDKYGDDVAWVYRHYPLSFHPHAKDLAEIGECVAEYTSEEAFWSYSDAIYEKMADKSIYTTQGDKSIITEATMLKLATDAGASFDEIKKCADSNEMVNRVNDMMSGAGDAGITGTPTTVIISEKGGFEKIPGALPFAQVDKMLQNHL